jgi:hypothetical protein
MRNALVPYLASVVAGVGLVFFSAGCKKSQAPADADQIEASLKLPGATNVMAALDRKDYEAALGNLLKIREGVASEQELMDYMLLSRLAKDRLMDAATTNAQAAEALNVLRSMTTGR